jgi:hypothetical protein
LLPWGVTLPRAIRHQPPVAGRLAAIQRQPGHQRGKLSPNHRTTCRPCGIFPPVNRQSLNGFGCTRENLFEKVVHGAPIFAPLLFPILALLAGIGLWVLRQKSSTVEKPAKLAM